MSRIDPEAIKAFWWAVSWGGAIIFSIFVWVIEAVIGILVLGLLVPKDWYPKSFR